MISHEWLFILKLQIKKNNNLSEIDSSWRDVCEGPRHRLNDEREKKKRAHANEIN